MNIFKQGIGITQTIKNAARFREIITVFAQNGLDEFIIRSGLHKVVPDFVLPSARINAAIKEFGDASWASVMGHRLRRSFEELGPSFIKLGQLLSTREDLFPVEFVEQLKLLRDRAKGVPFEDALRAISQSLGQDYREVFQSIDPKPIGTASIGLVYKAKLKSGEDVVIKIRRPGIQKTIPTDLNIMELMADRLERVNDEIRYLGISRVVRDFGENLQNELDFRREALNCKRIKQNLSKIDQQNFFYIPDNYDQFTREDLLVLEELKGIPFSHLQKGSEEIAIVQAKLADSIQIFIRTLLADGFFHADLHTGNFFLLKNGQIGLVDFGLMGHLSKKSRVVLVAILYSIITHNYENLVFEFLDVADYEDIPDIDELVRDIKGALTPYVGLSAQQINLTQLFSKSVRVLSKHRIYLPQEWFIIFRALITLDGVGKSLGMDIEIFSIIEKNLKSVTKEILSKDNIVEEGILTSRDFITSIRILPRHARWFMREFAKNKYAFRIVHTGHEQSLNSLRNAVIFFGYNLIAGVFFISGVLLIENQILGRWYVISRLTCIFWGVGTVLFALGIRAIR